MKKNPYTMVSVEKWKEHFKKMATKSYPKEAMYIVSQSGRGLGRNGLSKTIYQIRTPSSGSGGKPTIEIVSPVSSSLERARALVKTKAIKKKKKSKSSNKTSGSQTVKTSKKKKKNKKKTGAKKPKVAKPKKKVPKKQTKKVNKKKK